MGYKPKLDRKNKIYKVKDLTIADVAKIKEKASKRSSRHELIVRLALRNVSTLEIEKMKCIKSESDRNRGEAVTSRTIYGLVQELTRDANLKFKIKDLNIYAQRRDISVIDF